MNHCAMCGRRFRKPPYARVKGGEEELLLCDEVCAKGWPIEAGSRLEVETSQGGAS